VSISTIRNLILLLLAGCVVSLGALLYWERQRNELRAREIAARHEAKLLRFQSAEVAEIRCDISFRNSIPVQVTSVKLKDHPILQKLLEKSLAPVKSDVSYERWIPELSDGFHAPCEKLKYVALNREGKTIVEAVVKVRDHYTQVGTGQGVAAASALTYECFVDDESRVVWNPVDFEELKATILPLSGPGMRPTPVPP